MADDNEIVRGDPRARRKALVILVAVSIFAVALELPADRYLETLKAYGAFSIGVALAGLLSYTGFQALELFKSFDMSFKAASNTETERGALQTPHH